MSSEIYLQPDWPAPAHVRACVTTRAGGVSTGIYAGLNLGDHVGDDPAAVAENRARVTREVGVPPLWLAQVHGCGVVDAAARVGHDAAPPVADAALARAPGVACAVMTADCLPVLFCDRAGSVVAAAHAGWRGLADGVLDATIGAMDVPPAELLAWLGPAIGPQGFEVGDEVRAAFVAIDTAMADCFVPGMREGKWQADLFALARLHLRACGVGWVGGGGVCTWSDPARFYSYRRDGVTGRFASLVWLASAG